MTVLEATVEIVKATLNGASASAPLLLTVNKDREVFLKGIEEVYKKLKELEKKESQIAGGVI